MVIDCDRCAVRGQACGDCVVGVLLGVPSVPPRRVTEAPEERPSGASAVQLDARERRALEVLADQGLIPRLRLVPESTRSVVEHGHEKDTIRDVG